MSHLLKENKNIFKLFKLIILSLILILFYKSIKVYPGNIFIYLFFSIVSNFIIFFSFRKKFIFFDTFFGILIWLGFWFKTSMILSFPETLYFSEGINPNIHKFESIDYDNALIVSTVGMLGFIFAGYLREFYFYYPNNIKIELNSDFYKKHRKLLLSIFLSLILIIFFTNIYFKIYQRGIVPEQDINFIISGIYKTLLLYGLTMISCFIIYNEILLYKKVFIVTILISIFEIFLSSVSMLSRGMIFNSVTIVYSLYKFSNKIKLKSNLIFFLVKVFMVLLLFYTSVISVNYIRMKYFGVGVSLKTSDKSTLYAYEDYQEMINDKNIKRYDSFNKFKVLGVNRWVGIDAIMIIASNSKKLGFSFFKESLSEKFSADDYSFYEKNFKLKETGYKQNKNVKGNTLPGLMAFLFYSGSKTFLFLMMTLFCLFGSFLEYLMYRASNFNMIASALIGQVIAYRLAHFGYLPLNSYLLFGSIILVIILVYFFKIFKKNYDY